MRLLSQIAGWLLAGIVLVWRLSCRYRIERDPRPGLRAQGRPYAYALLHAHQIAAVFVNDEDRMGAMVSRSADGELLVPSLLVRRVRAVRGSTRKDDRDKGGGEALQRLADLLRQRVPVLLAVDGPRGPRNHVHKGVAKLALETGAAVLPTMVLPSRRFFLGKTWDRMQVPQPFSTVRLCFGPPIEPTGGEDPERLRHRIEGALERLEAEQDPLEHARARAHRIAREAR